MFLFMCKDTPFLYQKYTKSLIYFINNMVKITYQHSKYIILSSSDYKLSSLNFKNHKSLIFYNKMKRKGASFKNQALLFY